MPSTDPINQHYITRAYLEGFLNPRATNVWVFRRNGNEFATSPKKVARIRHYFSRFKSDGTIDYSLEHYQTNQIETPGVEALRKLNTNRSLSTQQRSALALLVALHTVRVPYERDFMDDHGMRVLQSYLTRLDELSVSSGKPVDFLDVATSNSALKPPGREDWRRLRRADIEAYIQQLEKDPGAHSRRAFLFVARAIAKVYVNMKWQVHIAREGSFFITSDCPVVKTFKNTSGFGEGIKRLDCEVNFPLSRTAMLVMKHDVNLVEKVSRRARNKPKSKTQTTRILERLESTPDEIQQFNEMIVDSAADLVFSSDNLHWIADRMRSRPKSPKRAKVVRSDRFQYKGPHGTEELTMQEVAARTNPIIREK